MMEVIGTIDQGIIKAIKNSGMIRWLLTPDTCIRIYLYSLCGIPYMFPDQFPYCFYLRPQTRSDNIWLLTFSSSLRSEDIKEYVKNFVNDYLSIDSETWGAAGVDSKATATRIEPKDYVPNAVQTKETINRIYSCREYFL